MQALGNIAHKCCKPRQQGGSLRLHAKRGSVTLPQCELRGLSPEPTRLRSGAAVRIVNSHWRRGHGVYRSCTGGVAEFQVCSSGTRSG